MVVEEQQRKDNENLLKRKSKEMNFINPSGSITGSKIDIYKSVAGWKCEAEENKLF